MRHFNQFIFYICAHRLKCCETCCCRNFHLILFFDMWRWEDRLWLSSRLIKMRCDLAFNVRFIRDLIILNCKIVVQSIMLYWFIIELRLCFVHLFIDLISRMISWMIIKFCLNIIFSVQMIDQSKWHSQISLISFKITKL